MRSSPLSWFPDLERYTARSGPRLDNRITLDKEGTNGSPLVRPAVTGIATGRGLRGGPSSGKQGFYCCHGVIGIVSGPAVRPEAGGGRLARDGSSPQQDWSLGTDGTNGIHAMGQSR
jgi:hypothetical protein